MLPNDDEIEVDSCGTKCCNAFYKAWNFIAVLLWGGMCFGFYKFRRPQMLEEECPMPWDIFFLVDTGFQALYYLTALLVQCCVDAEGDTKKPAQMVHVLRMCCCVPTSCCSWILGVIFGAINWTCFEYKAAPPRQWFFQYTAAGYTGIRMFQNCLTWLILCLQCCALDTFRKQGITAEISGLEEKHQAIAASTAVQNWAIIVGVKTIGHDALVGFGAAEEYRRRKRDLEEGYKVYKKQKKGKRNYTVKHVKTKVEIEEEKAMKRIEGHQPVFPFMRMTHVVRQQDVTLDDPFKHLGKGSTDLAAANKAAKVVAHAAANVAKRSGGHMVGVAARRGL